MELNDYSDFAPQSLGRTPEGYLTGRIRATCSGVFPYLVDDGTTVRRLRPDSEVGNADSVASLNSKPVTLLHPGTSVGPENAKGLQVGFTGTDAAWDGSYVSVTMTITDRDAIRAIEEGKVRAVSCGYDVQELLDDRGVWRGTAYDQVMKGIGYNHVALVSEGRAGDGVGFRVRDCADYEDSLNKGEDMKTMVIDGVQCQADEAVVARIQGLEKQLRDSAESLAAKVSELDKATAERDAALADNAQLKAERLTDSQVAERVKERLALIERAKGYGCEVKAEDSEDSIKGAVIAKAFGDGIALDGKSDDYKEAMFDAATASLDSKAAEAKAVKDSALVADYSKLPEGSGDAAEAAYRKMCDQLLNKKEK